ncbi:MAG: putative RNA uridine N3 methyltransferase [Candidatus Helarchaeota archaeon]
MKISIAIPTSILEESPDLRSKTIKLGQIARACAIFRVNQIFLIEDEMDKDVSLIKTILEYVECPQYLRKRLFPISNSLKYAGLLPPLAIPHHQLERKRQALHPGDFREGVVCKSTNKESSVEIGLEHPIKVRPSRLKLGTRVTVKITEVGKTLRGEIINSDEIPFYWGYKVKCCSLKSLFKKQNKGLRIGLSRKGRFFGDEKNTLLQRFEQEQSILLIFGSAKKGIQAFFKRENINMMKNVDFLINLVRDQGTRTIRTEEAILIALSLINSIIL